MLIAVAAYICCKISAATVLTAPWHFFVHIVPFLTRTDIGSDAVHSVQYNRNRSLPHP